ncbi:hypothetical protein BACDOR_03755 [Phocaeicola dorei DSM 17855]|nr:hypothetical protein BACDOR_03755 [Phocaeicola dorei DSM 17855]
MVEHPSCGYQPFRLWVFTPLGNQHLSVLVVGLLAVVAEEIDAGGKEVDGRGLEELVAATAAFLLAFLQGFKQGLGGLARCGKVVDVLQLDGVHTARILHIHKVDDVELHAMGHLAVLGILVLQVMIVEFGGESGKLIVVHHHGKALLAVLPDKRLDDGEGLTRTRSTHNPCATERIDDVHPSLAELALVIIAHRDVHAVLVLLQLPALLKALILEVEAVFQQPFLQELRDIVEGDMHQYDTDDGSEHIEPSVQTEGIETGHYRMTEQPYGLHNQQHSRQQRIEHLPASVKLQMLLVARSHTGDTYQQERSHLAIHEVAVMVNHPPLDASVDIRHYAAQEVQLLRLQCVGEELHQDGDINHRPEYLVKTL